ncbi:hypothetical protein [Nonomuraea guangzhouensis]|uniref:Tetratricopeptide repeat protein n=1 Tax=Nonomuraea guangzhouensis TaxID=1291555 RepID=A0ABW4GQE3_9ACTN|nr:hypothetical protein [Nonomuraea guangzhouensis]
MCHNPPDAELLALIEAFVGAASWSESRAIVTRHPELLSDRADALLGGYPPVYREVLRDARRAGIRQAFDAVSTQGVPEGLRASWLAAIRAREEADADNNAGKRDRSILLLSRLVADPLFSQATPHMQATMAYVLGLAAINRFFEEHRDSDLELAVAGFAACVAAAPEPHHLTALGNVHGIRYEHHEDTADLLAAIDAGRRAVALSDEDDPVVLHDLAVNLGIWYELDGATEILNEAITTSARAIRAGSATEFLPTLLSTLTNCLTIRYEHRGSLSDLEEAIDTARRAIDLDGDTSEAAMLRATLGDLLQLRFARDRDPATLAEASAILEGAAAELPPGSLPAAICLGHLGNVHLNRFETGEDTLPAAEDAFRRAIGGCPPGSPHITRLWNGLGLTLLACGDVEAAIGAFREAGEEDPLARGNLASAHRARHDVQGRPEDLAAGIEGFEYAVTAALGRQPEIALDVGRRWAEWATVRQAWTEAAKAYRLAVDAARWLFRAQHERGAWEMWLRTEADLAAGAAYAFVRAGGPKEAAAVLEGGRARVSAEALHDPVRLRARLGVLADRYARASRHVRELESVSLSKLLE